MTQQVPSIEPELSGVRNFRDVGGLPTVDGRRVTYGRLYRSGHLAHATPADAKFLTDLGLHTIFDFRSDTDRGLEGVDVALDGVRNVRIPLIDPAHSADFWTMVREGGLDELRTMLSDDQAAQQMIKSYERMITGRTEEMGTVLRALAEDSLPALLHCAAGKDRAGVSIAVTLLALGVERDAIEADYLKSNVTHRRYRIHRSNTSPDAMSEEVMELLSPLFDARTEYLATAFETIEQTWGSTDDYLQRGLGVTPEIRARLRERLLD